MNILNMQYDTEVVPNQTNINSVVTWGKPLTHYKAQSTAHNQCKTVHKQEYKKKIQT